MQRFFGFSSFVILLPVLLHGQHSDPAKPDLSGRSDESIREVVRRVAHHQVRPVKDGAYADVATVEELKAAAKPEGIDWSYPWGVTLYGVLRSADITGDVSARKFVYEHNRVVGRYYTWLNKVRLKIGDDPLRPLFRGDHEFPIARLMRLGNLDNCGAMGAEILEAAIREPAELDADQTMLVARISRWITEQQERLPDGTFWRPMASDVSGKWPKGTIWADDLYMSCPYLVRLSRYTKDERYIIDAAHNLMGMASRLQDADGLWFHAYCVPAHEHSPFKWGRANGWVAVSLAEVLSAMPQDHPDRAAVLEIFRRQILGLKRVQSPTGMWRQILDRPELWEETSCTAMFAYAIARGVNRGWLPASDMAGARAAFAALCAHAITENGEVNGTCMGTGIGLNAEYYVNRPRPNDDLHGRGAVLLAGTEIVAGNR